MTRLQGFRFLRPIAPRSSLSTATVPRLLLQDNNNNIIIIIIIIIAPHAYLCTVPRLLLQAGSQQLIEPRQIVASRIFFTPGLQGKWPCVCVCASILKMLHFHQNFQIGRVVQITQLYTEFVSHCYLVI